MIHWYTIKDFYYFEGKKLRHSKSPKTKWIKLKCVYKIKIKNPTLSPKNIKILNKLIKIFFLLISPSKNSSIIFIIYK